MNSINKDYSTIILSAGKSTRMGVPKFSLLYKNQEMFIEHLAREYTDFGSRQVIIVFNKEGFEFISEHKTQFADNVKLVLNEYPEYHRFYSLKIATKALDFPQSVFVHNVDNPFVNQDVLRALLKYNAQGDYLNPTFEGAGGHPILLSENIVSAFREAEQDTIHLREFLNQFKRLRVPVSDANILVNLNTPEEFEAYFK